MWIPDTNVWIRYLIRNHHWHQAFSNSLHLRFSSYLLPSNSYKFNSLAYILTQKYFSYYLNTIFFAVSAKPYLMDEITHNTIVTFIWRIAIRRESEGLKRVGAR